MAWWRAVCKTDPSADCRACDPYTSTSCAPGCTLITFCSSEVLCHGAPGDPADVQNWICFNEVASLDTDCGCDNAAHTSGVCWPPINAVQLSADEAAALGLGPCPGCESPGGICLWIIECASGYSQCVCGTLESVTSFAQFLSSTGQCPGGATIRLAIGSDCPGVTCLPCNGRIYVCGGKVAIVDGRAVIGCPAEPLGTCSLCNGGEAPTEVPVNYNPFTFEQSTIVLPPYNNCGYRAARSEGGIGQPGAIFAVTFGATAIQAAFATLGGGVAPSEAIWRKTVTAPYDCLATQTLSLVSYSGFFFPPPSTITIN